MWKHERYMPQGDLWWDDASYAAYQAYDAEMHEHQDYLDRMACIIRDQPVMFAKPDLKLDRHGKKCEGCMNTGWAFCDTCQTCLMKDGKPTNWDDIPF